MKNLVLLHPMATITVLMLFYAILPSGIFAQSSMTHTTEIPLLENEPSSQSGPVITFKIPFSSVHTSMMNILILDLPQGASLQYNGESIYQINNMPNENKHYSIELRTGGDILNGVTTQDISLIQRHILGNGPLSNDFKLIAADVNCDGRVSAVDMVEIRRAILGRIDKFGCNTNYAFVPASLEFEWTGTTINLGEFIPVKLGDVNGNAAANSEN